jgi:hypothetical protein
VEVKWMQRCVVENVAFVLVFIFGPCWERDSEWDTPTPVVFAKEAASDWKDGSCEFVSAQRGGKSKRGKEIREVEGVREGKEGPLGRGGTGWSREFTTDDSMDVEYVQVHL